jgi:ribosome-binding factor A
MSRRLPRLNEQLKRELSELIRTAVRDPRVGLVTITGVDTARDLGSAKVYVRVVGGGEELTATIEGLEAAAPFLRGALGRILSIRRIPELRFRVDRSYEHARRIEEVLAEVIPEGVDTADETEDDGDRIEEGSGESE